MPHDEMDDKMERSMPKKGKRMPKEGKMPRDECHERMKRELRKYGTVEEE